MYIPKLTIPNNKSIGIWSNLLSKFVGIINFNKVKDGKEPSEILAEREYDYEMTGHEHEHRPF